MKNKIEKVGIAVTSGLIGLAVGATATIYLSEKFNECYNSIHDDEYIQRLIKDNITLDKMNKDLRHIIEEEIQNENKVNGE